MGHGTGLRLACALGLLGAAVAAGGCGWELRMPGYLTGPGDGDDTAAAADDGDRDDGTTDAMADAPMPTDGADASSADVATDDGGGADPPDDGLVVDPARCDGACAAFGAAAACVRTFDGRGDPDAAVYQCCGAPDVGCTGATFTCGPRPARQCLGMPTGGYRCCAFP